VPRDEFLGAIRAVRAIKGDGGCHNCHFGSQLYYTPKGRIKRKRHRSEPSDALASGGTHTLPITLASVLEPRTAFEDGALLVQYIYWPVYSNEEEGKSSE